MSSVKIIVYSVFCNWRANEKKLTITIISGKRCFSDIEHNCFNLNIIVPILMILRIRTSAVTVSYFD